MLEAPRCSADLALACRWVLVAGVLVPGLAPELDLRLGWLIKMGRAWFGVPDSAVGRGVQDGGPSFPLSDGCGNGLWRKDRWLAGKKWEWWSDWLSRKGAMAGWSDWLSRKGAMAGWSGLSLGRCSYVLVGTCYSTGRIGSSCHFGARARCGSLEGMVTCPGLPYDAGLCSRGP